MWENGLKSRQFYYYLIIIIIIIIIIIMNNGVHFNENTAWFKIEISLTYAYRWKKQRPVF